MKKNIFYSVLIATSIYVVGCKKDSFLQDGSFSGTNDITEAQLWANPDYARNFLNNVYAALPANRYNVDDGGALFASGSDEAVNSNLNSSVNTLNNGTWSAGRTFDDVYTDMYVGIRKANMFLEKVDGSAVIPLDETLPANVPANQTYEAQVDRLKGQAYFLRAFFQFELLKRYGSFVIVTKTLTVNDNLDLPRNTFTECVKQISDDCEAAITRLPLSPTEWRTTDRGRATQTAAMALKARLLLYAASPQYNPTNDLTKWQAAADAAKRIMDTGKHSIYSSYPNIWLWNNGAYNIETIFASQTQNVNTIEVNNAPVSYDAANGRTNPTQEQVDAFEMKTTGRLITDNASGYNANNPYLNRDPRLAFTVMFNTASVQPIVAAYNFKSKPVETFVGGKDGLGLNVNATKTGYYLRKYLSESASWAGTTTTVRRPWIFFRYAEVLLNYAEALNEAQGTAAMPQVIAALNLIRARSGVAMPALQTSNPAGNGYVAPNQAELRKRIRNERRVELCFEEQRFYDVRRWKEGEVTFNKPVTGMRIERLTATTFSYTPFTVENRVFSSKNYLFPISQNELNRAPALGQNPGY